MNTESFAPRAIYNPLTSPAGSATASSSQTLKAEASLFNTDIGVCPKCKQPMTRAIIANNDPVFYCEVDRVSMPLPDDLLQG